MLGPISSGCANVRRAGELAAPCLCPHPELRARRIPETPQGSLPLPAVTGCGGAGQARTTVGSHCRGSSAGALSAQEGEERDVRSGGGWRRLSARRAVAEAAAAAAGGDVGCRHAGLRSSANRRRCSGPGCSQWLRRARGPAGREAAATLRLPAGRAPRRRAMGTVPSALKHCLSYQHLLKEQLWIGDPAVPPPAAPHPGQVSPGGGEGLGWPRACEARPPPGGGLGPSGLGDPAAAPRPSRTSPASLLPPACARPAAEGNGLSHPHTPLGLSWAVSEKAASSINKLSDW